jgi:hypothetical protein
MIKKEKSHRALIVSRARKIIGAPRTASNCIGGRHPRAPTRDHMTAGSAFFPVVGVVLSNVLYFSSWPAVQTAYTTGRLGSLNVLPTALMVVSSIRARTPTNSAAFEHERRRDEGPESSTRQARHSPRHCPPLTSHVHRTLPTLHSGASRHRRSERVGDALHEDELQGAVR